AAFLLDRLTPDPDFKRTANRILVVGGVDYDQPPQAARIEEELALGAPVLGPNTVAWRALPATVREQRQVLELAHESHEWPRFPIQVQKTGISSSLRG